MFFTNLKRKAVGITSPRFALSVFAKLNATGHLVEKVNLCPMFLVFGRFCLDKALIHLFVLQV